MTDGSTTKAVGRMSYKHTPSVFGNKEKIVVHIKKFADLEQERNQPVYGTTVRQNSGSIVIEACGYPWSIKVYPRGDTQSCTKNKHVSIFLCYNADNSNAMDQVWAKAVIRTKTINRYLRNNDYDVKGKPNFGFFDFSKRDDVIQNDCNDEGTLVITVEVQVATKKMSVWFPPLHYRDNIMGTKLFAGRGRTSNVTFIVGISKKEFFGHKCIVELRARPLYELIITVKKREEEEEEEESSSNDDDDHSEDRNRIRNNTELLLPDIDEKVFGNLLEFFYTDKVPILEGDDDEDEEKAGSILLVADQFGCTDLKLCMESIIIERFLVPSTVVKYLYLAESHSCALLKEAAMNMYIINTKKVIGESDNDDWNSLQQSTALFVELLVYSTSNHNKYSSIANDGNGTVYDADDFDVTSLRERLVKFDLDADGSRKMLLQRWKDYLLANN